MQLLVRIVDKVNPSDPIKSAKLGKRGDVIWYKPDGEAWGTQEEANPDWVILQVPNLGVAECESLIAPEPGDSRANRMLRKRGLRLADSVLPSYTGQRNRNVNVNSSKLRDAMIVKTPLEDPNLVT